MKQLTQEEFEAAIDETFVYNAETGLLYRKLYRGKPCKKRVTGSIDSRGYVTVSFNGKTHLVHRIAYFLYHGYFPKGDIDHDDRIRHHNYISNLIDSTRQNNNRNSGNPKNCTSGVKGVTRCGEKWRSQIKINRKNYQLGDYTDFDDAVCARLAGEQCLNWCSGTPADLFVRRRTQC